MGMRPAMALILSEGDVWKAPVIQRAALLCIFFNLVMFLIIGAPLKNHSWNPYIAMGMMHVLYRRHFWIGRSPREEFSSIFMALRVDKHLVA